MKTSLTAISLAALAWGSFAQDAAPMPSVQPEYTPNQLLETWGWVLAEQFNLRGLEITSDEIETIARGMTKYVENQEPATNLDYSLQQMQYYFATRERQITARQVQEGKAREQHFFDSLVGQPNIHSLGTGLRFEILEPGSDVKPSPSDQVRVHYRGALLDGTEFDSSYSRGEPAEFDLGSVIPAWTQGLPLIGEGGKIKLYAPAKLGYGDAPQQGIPAASTLIFEIELLKVLPPSQFQ